MKNLPPFAVFLFVLNIAAIGQTLNTTNTEIVWGYEQNCSTRNSEFVKTEMPRCERVRTDQGIFFITSYKGVSIAVSYSNHRALVRVAAQVTNRSGQTQEFDTSLSTIDVFNSQSAYLKGKKRQDVLPGISAEAAKDLYVKDEAKYVVVDPFAGRTVPPITSPVEAPTVTYTEKNGRLTNVTTGVPNSPKQPDETRIVLDEPKTSSGPYMPRIPVAPNTPSATALARFDYGIRSGPIADQQKAVGYLFFEKSKILVPFAVFRIRVGDWVFVFPEETLKDQKKLAKKK